MYTFLRKIPLFAELPEPDLLKLCEGVEEIHLTAGQQLFAEGDPGQRAYVIREGQLEIVKSTRGRELLLAVRERGEVIGELALLEDMPRSASVRARKDSVLLTIHKEQLEHLLNTSVSASHAMFRTILARWRATESSLRESEKMAQLGTLAAGITHELNNPAAAVKRGAQQLEFALTDLREAQAGIDHLTLTPPQQDALDKLMLRAREQAARPPEMDALVRSDREYMLEEWLEDQGVEDAWEVAPTLVNLDYQHEDLVTLVSCYTAEQIGLVISFLNAIYDVYNLLSEISGGAGRISGIVGALKSYSYLDQAPVQAVDVHKGLDDTLLILQHKLKKGVNVRRQYAEDLPQIEGYGSELNQVWTNIIDNAIDAMDGNGEITIRTRYEKEQDAVVVEIWDNGPGIPEKIRSRIFEPFFTTKPPGKGTGLGLDISYNIVTHKHRGEIKVNSQPGMTCFEVWLPVNFDAK